MRINKFLALCGLASRRKCEEYILRGEIAVNGQTVTELSYNIDEAKDDVSFKGKRLFLPNTLEYYLLNKPKGCVCAVKPTKNEKTVVEYIKTSSRIYPVGRLDKDTEGVLLLTNDGELTQKLTHPGFEKNKTYKVTVVGRITDPEIKKLENGIELDGKKTSPATARLIFRNEGCNEGCSVFELTIHEGRNRQVRRMCEAIGHDVTELIRTKVDGIGLGDLKSGEYRELTENEVEMLKFGN